MRVSVIIPAYNVAPYLYKCVASLLCQTYSNVEVIVVNDGSTDNTADVVSAFSDTRVILVNTENQGVTAARKVGWKRSTGDYCLFLDGDDTLAVDAIEFFVDKIKEGGYDFISGWYDIVDQNDVHTDVYCAHIEGEYDNAGYIKSSLNAVGDFQSICIGIYNSKVINEEVFAIDRSIYRGEDAMTLLGILNNCKSILVTNKVFYHYFNRSDSVTKGVPLSVEYLYEYNKFRYARLKPELRHLIDFNTLQRLLPAYLRLSMSNSIKDGDEQLIQHLIKSCNSVSKTIKLKIQILCFNKSLFRRVYLALIKIKR